MMRIDVITLFPDMFIGPVTESILGRASSFVSASQKTTDDKQEASKMQIHIHDLRDWGLGNHRQVDDEPYGGGAGMLMRADVVVPAIEAVTEAGKKEGAVVEPHRIYLSARGERLAQEKVEHLAQSHEWLILLCGHYEGIDQRISDLVIDEEVSIGDYVLTGGELPAMVLIDAVARHIPGVLGHEDSALEESFSAVLDRKKEYPHYTRPEEFRDLKVPEVLLSGHHKKIAEWRRDQLK